MRELIFEVTQEADGGYWAECLTETIVTATAITAWSSPIVNGLRPSFERSLMASTCSAGFSRRYPSRCAILKNIRTILTYRFIVGPTPQISLPEFAGERNTLGLMSP